MSESNDFYVGYLPRAPGRLGRWLRNVVVTMLVLAGAFGAVLVTRQDRFGPGVFEFGIEREFTGIVLEQPVPALFIMQDARGVEEPLLLAAFGKHGAAEFVQGMHGQPMRLRGSLVHRNGRALIEVHSAERLSPEQAAGLTMPPGVDRGEVTLMGEIVDSKCFLGVMKPGHTKPHRGCAVRCISGGIPPMLLVVEPDGTARHLLLAGADGAMINTEVLPFVAESVEITGTIRAYADLEVLHADPGTYRRVSE